MTKRSISQEVSAETGLTQETALDAVQVALDTIANALVNGQTVELRDFGVFEIQERKAKVGNNPRTGERVEIPARRVVKFKPGKALREQVATATIN